MTDTDVLLRLHQSELWDRFMETPIPQDVAAYVLRHFDHRAGTWEPGNFYERLLDAVTAADGGNQALLALGFPEVVLAVQMAKDLPGGIRQLQAVIGLQRCPDCAGRGGLDGGPTGFMTCASCEGSKIVRKVLDSDTLVRWRNLRGRYDVGRVGAVDTSRDEVLLRFDGELITRSIAEVEVVP